MLRTVFGLKPPSSPRPERDHQSEEPAPKTRAPNPRLFNSLLGATDAVDEIDAALTVHAVAYRTFTAERDAYDAWAARHAPVIEQRALIRRAIGDAAIYRARYTPEPPDRAERVEDAVLGRRPSSGPARKDWERAATNLNRAITEAEQRRPEAGAEL